MYRLIQRFSGFIALLLAVTATSAPPAAAHPHVFVTVNGTVLFDKGAVSGFAHVWTFDELYTAMAVEGLDKNGDGRFDREELSELAKVNVEGLKEFDYFTSAVLSGAALRLGEPRDVWMQHKDGVLTLHFTTPLAAPVLAEVKGLAFQISDPSFFIAFELAKDDPVKLGDGAPPACKLDVGVPKAEAATAERLAGAFATQMSGAGLGFGIVKTIQLDCSGK